MCGAVSGPQGAGQRGVREVQVRAAGRETGAGLRGGDMRQGHLRSGQRHAAPPEPSHRSVEELSWMGCSIVSLVAR